MITVMRDYAWLDPRSVKAGLVGRDDGRVDCYERAFEKMHIPGKEMSHRELIYQVGAYMDFGLPSLLQLRLARKSRMKGFAQQFVGASTFAVGMSSALFLAVSLSGL